MSVTALHQERTMTDRGTRMNAIVSAQYGLDGLEFRELDKPEIEDDQVLVRVHASSVNPAEWYRVMGPFFVRLFGEGLRAPKKAKDQRTLRASWMKNGTSAHELRAAASVRGNRKRARQTSHAANAIRR